MYSTTQIQTRISDLYVDHKKFYNNWTVKELLLLDWLISKYGNRWTDFGSMFFVSLYFVFDV